MDELLRPPTAPLALQATDTLEDEFPGPTAIKPLSQRLRRPTSAAASRNRSLLAIATPARRGKLQLGE
jgi:hypothetical protein